MLEEKINIDLVYIASVIAILAIIFVYFAPKKKRCDTIPIKADHYLYLTSEFVDVYLEKLKNRLIAASTENKNTIIKNYKVVEKHMDKAKKSLKRYIGENNCPVINVNYNMYELIIRENELANDDIDVVLFDKYKASLYEIIGYIDVIINCQKQVRVLDIHDLLELIRLIDIKESDAYYGYIDIADDSFINEDREDMPIMLNKKKFTLTRSNHSEMSQDLEKGLKSRFGPNAEEGEYYANDLDNILRPLNKEPYDISRVLISENSQDM